MCKTLRKTLSRSKNQKTIGETRKKVKVTILWQGNSISYNKSFGKLKCSLCMKERLKILSFQRENSNLIINSNSEFYGACRHRPKFYRYAPTTPLSVLMTNNSSERVPFPSFSNISTTICTYVEDEVPNHENSQLAILGTRENSGVTELNYADL